jgi:hypothetical protein
MWCGAACARVVVHPVLREVCARRCARYTPMTRRGRIFRDFFWRCSRACSDDLVYAITPCLLALLHARRSTWAVAIARLGRAGKGYCLTTSEFSIQILGTSPTPKVVVNQ